MPSTSEAARLFVMLARQAPVGVIFRRGPSRWTQVIKWDTSCDAFEFGAWFHGKIYEERGDLSPDGTRLIYFASNGPLSHPNGFPGTYTAISKAPWLTALAAWPHWGTYYGGGLFETDSSVWVNSGHPDAEPHPGFEPQGLRVSYEHPFWDHDWHTLFRLEQAGWKPIEPFPTGSVPLYRIQPHGPWTMEPSDPACPLMTRIQTVHRKASRHSRLSLAMISTYNYGLSVKNSRARTFELRNSEQKSATPLAGVSWADWDSRGRLVYAKDGKLFAASFDRSDELMPVELADFNACRPRRTKAPPWAREW